MKARLLGTLRPAPAAEVAAAPSRGGRRRAVAPRPSSPVLEEELDEGDDSLSDSDFQSTIGAWRGMQSCLVGQGARGPEGKSALRVSMTIRPDGAVSHSKVVDASNAFAENMAPCVERQARRLRFPAFTAGTEVTKVAKFIF
jgi:hypothetical protein